ncbi:extracellular elastinolytic metallo proteinase [Penicillium angulare]|uniref:extracellular elastinolytic metallo proteinase n=1 Tax=Penicillium angulare TaxID=116970 RepID=UPI002541D049|nr:extracellular elastinolytic metallo proteinase [Penicillium angulare]KAJ5291708.1 extracellular elastinolytic metallo proteinase [Penicillium angulare]
MKGAWIEPIEKGKRYTFRGMSGTVSDPKADENLALTWKLETNPGANWLVTYVDAETNYKVYAVVDYVSYATYKVYDWAAHGNNAIAQFNPSGGDGYLDNFRPDSPDLQFEYTYSPSSSSPTSYINASITQAFYTLNIYHDLLYVLGFNRKAGNFQWNNNGKGGVGGDYVIIDTQDSYDFDLGTFISPADGQPGRLFLGLWHNSVPDRDGSFDAGLVIHGYTHGLSHRLTGGPATPGCLNGLESGGMGEGWSNFMAISVRLKPHDTRAMEYAFAEWAGNNKKGIREYLYSKPMDTNPLIGNVWGQYANGIPTDGKYLTMKLVIDGMALLPCTPNFLQARVAIIDADVAPTNGSYL